MFLDRLDDCVNNLSAWIENVWMCLRTDSTQPVGQVCCNTSFQRRKNKNPPKKLTNRKHMLIFTVDPGAITKISLLIFFQLQIINYKVKIQWKQQLFIVIIISPFTWCRRQQQSVKLKRSAATAAYHLCNASVCEDVACMDEAVQHLGCLLDQVALVGVVF